MSSGTRSVQFYLYELVLQEAAFFPLDMEWEKPVLEVALVLRFAKQDGR